MTMRKKREVRKALHDFNKRHAEQFKIHNSPLDVPGETNEKKFARLKWLERGAGFIQALRWVLDRDYEIPEWINWFGKVDLESIVNVKDSDD